MADDQVSVEITIEEKAALRALTQLSKGVDRFTNDTVKQVKKSDAAFASFAGNLAAAGASKAFSVISSGLKNIATGSFEAAIATEKIKTQLEILTGSQEKSTKLYKELLNFSKSTPFQLQSIAEASAQLLSFGFAADTVQERIRKIGDVASGSNSDLKEVALIYGQVAAAGKLTGERLLQFQERAIPIGAALAKSLGVAESQVKDLVSSGVVGFAEFEKAFNSMSEAGGIFEGSIDKQSRTISGSLSTLADNFQIVQTKIGDLVAPTAISTIQSLTSALQSLGEALDDDSSGLSLFAQAVGDTIGNVAGFAGEVIRVETPLEKVTNQIAELLDKQQNLAKNAKEAKETMGSFFGVFDSDKEKTIARIAVNTASLEQEIQKLEKTRQNILKSAAVESDRAGDSAEIESLRESQAQYEEFERKRLEAQMVNDEKFKAQRLKLNSELEIIQAEYEARKAEAGLLKSEVTVEGRLAEFEALKAFEQQKIDAIYNAEVEKNKLLKDEKSRELANDKAVLQQKIANIKLEQDAKKRQAEFENQLQSSRIAAAQGFLNVGLTLAKQGSAEQRALQSANAVVNTYTAATSALASPPGPPFTYPLVASVIAQGFANVAKINGVSFANGGVFGGFVGATNGGDTTTANVRRGEMQLNAGQQRRLFDIADGKSGSGNSDLIGAINNLASQAITVEIDGREIARSVRNQKLEGFKV